MNQYPIVHYEEAVETMTEHYKEKNTAANENLNGV